MFFGCNNFTGCFLLQTLLSNPPYKSKMEDPWQKAYDFAVAVARKAGAVCLVWWLTSSVHTALNITLLMFKKLKWAFFKKNNLRWIDNVPKFYLIRKLGKLERVKSESWQRAPLWTSSPRLMRGLRKSSSGLLKRNSEKARTGESCIPTIPYLYIYICCCMWVFLTDPLLLCSAVSLGRSQLPKANHVSWLTNLHGS